MKKLLSTFAVLALALSAAGQGFAVRSLNGSGTNTTLYNPTLFSGTNAGHFNVQSNAIVRGQLLVTNAAYGAAARLHVTESFGTRLDFESDGFTTNSLVAGADEVTILNGHQGAQTELFTFNSSGALNISHLPLVGNGSGLTNLNASQLASGTVPVPRLPPEVVTNFYSLAQTNKNMLVVNNNGVQTLIDSNTITTFAATVSGTASASLLKSTYGGVNLSLRGQAPGAAPSGQSLVLGPESGGALTNLVFAFGTGQLSSPTNSTLAHRPGSPPTVALINLTNGPSDFVVSGSVTATNGFLLPTNGVPANLVAGRAYSTNGADDMTFAALASVSDSARVDTFVRIVNTDTTENTYTFPSGTRGDNGSIPATYVIPAGNEYEFRVTTYAQVATNVTRLWRSNTVEYVSSAVASGSAQPLIDVLATNVASLSLTAGTWDVSGNVSYSLSAAQAFQSISGITTTAHTLPTDGTEIYSILNFGVGISQTDTDSVPRKRLVLSATTTVYLVGYCDFNSGAVSAFGSLTAERVQ